MPLFLAPDVRQLRQAIEGIVTTTALSTASGVMNNGDKATITITTTNNAGAKLLGVADIALYVGSVATANIIPYGVSVDMSQWQMVGPFASLHETDGKNLVTQIYLRNISAGTQTVLVRDKTRAITNTITITSTSANT